MIKESLEGPRHLRLRIKSYSFRGYSAGGEEVVMVLQTTNRTNV